MKDKTTTSPAPKRIESKQSKRWLRCNLTNEEKLSAAKSQADKAIENISLENDAARISKEFKAKIAAAEADLQLLANKISSGYEHRNVTCLELLDDPEPGKKTIVRQDTHETVGVEDMSQSELQRELISE